MNIVTSAVGKELLLFAEQSLVAYREEAASCREQLIQGIEKHPL